MDRDVRLPLQVGTSALWSGARSAATFLPALGLIAFGIYVIFAVGPETLGFALLAFFVVCGGGLAYFSWRHFNLALRLRPSDVVLNASGIRIVGGRERDELIAWSEIAVAHCRITEADEPRVTLWFLLLAGISVAVSIAAESAVDLTPESKVRIYKLWLARKGEGDAAPLPAPRKLSRRQRRRLAAGESIAEPIPTANDVLIAETERPSERDSFQALVDSIRAACDQGDSPAPARVEGVLHCTQCRALLAPTEEPHATCTHCGAQVRVPEATRALLRSARTKASDDASLHRSVRRLLDQPGATHVNVMMALAALPMFIAWPAALYVAIKQYSADALAVTVTLPLVAFPLATILGCFLLVRVRLANRVALRILTLDFGARAPSRKGDPHACRQCGAPLPEAPGEVVARCLYCSAENLLGVDLRRAAARSSTAAASLRDALDERAKERWKFGVMALSAVALLVFGAEQLRRGLRIAPGPEARCRAGEVATCMSLGVAAESRAHKGGKFDKAAKWFEVACKGGDAHGCVLRGKLDDDGSPPFKKDVSAARPWYERACAAQTVEGCTALGSAFTRERNPGLAAQAYAHACDLGDGRGCFEAADRYAVAGDAVRARELFRRSCQLGWKPACNRAR